MCAPPEVLYIAMTPPTRLTENRHAIQSSADLRPLVFSFATDITLPTDITFPGDGGELWVFGNTEGEDSLNDFSLFVHRAERISGR